MTVRTDVAGQREVLESVGVSVEPVVREDRADPRDRSEIIEPVGSGMLSEDTSLRPEVGERSGIFIGDQIVSELPEVFLGKRKEIGESRDKKADHGKSRTPELSEYQTRFRRAVFSTIALARWPGKRLSLGFLVKDRC